MAKFVANPVVVDAFVIKSVYLHPLDEDGRYAGAALTLDIGLPLSSAVLKVEATPEMLSRISPQIGDYWVRQEDGYEYLNPKAVFEKKYSPLNTRQEKSNG